jgi:hypothetical protein
MGQRLHLGAHLVSSRTGYTHHGIYVGKARVIHYSGFSDGMNTGPVEETGLEVFSAGKGYYVKKHASRKFSELESVKRAKTRVGENLYSLLSNNCEHFVNWAIDGDHCSGQVDKGTVAGSGMGSAIVGGVGRGVIASAGTVAGLSGSGVMSGLATAGSLVGGGAVAGIGVLGGSGGLAAANLLNKTILKDDASLGTDERDSRSVGRKGTYAGAAVGTAGGIAAVSAMGTTAGLSAAGITSGLAAIGGTVGGGMAAGASVVVAAPVAAAAAIGYGIYKAVKWFKN